MGVGILVRTVANSPVSVHYKLTEKALMSIVMGITTATTVEMEKASTRRN